MTTLPTPDDAAGRAATTEPATRTFSFTLTWGSVTRTLSIVDTQDFGDVIVAFANMLRVNLDKGRLDRNGPWGKFAGQLWDLLIDAGYGPELTLSQGRMTVGHYTYPAKPPGLDASSAPAAIGGE